VLWCGTIIECLILIKYKLKLLKVIIKHKLLLKVKFNYNWRLKQFIFIYSKLNYRRDERGNGRLRNQGLLCSLKPIIFVLTNTHTETQK